MRRHSNFERAASGGLFMALVFALSCSCTALAAERVPFVGCAAEGQIGRIEAPKGIPKAVDVASAAAAQLAYYEGPYRWSILAPEGWDCFATYGSSGESVIVAPRLKHKLGAPRLNGSAIVFSHFYGDTSGAYAVADYLAHFFPDEGQAFVQALVDQGRAKTTDFHFGPFLDDRLTYEEGHLVEFETPADRDGFGTSGYLAKSSLPISGFVDYRPKDDASLLKLVMRLPPGLASLKSAILTYGETITLR